MKLRIRGNTIRLRLLRSEVTELAEHGIVSENTSFGGGSVLTYRIVSDGEAEAVASSFDEGIVTVSVPIADLLEWAEEDTRVGIEAESGSLRILIEKDFACPSREDDPDNLDSFPNPELVCT